jgi:hypothetical protein
LAPVVVSFDTNDAYLISSLFFLQVFLYLGTKERIQVARSIKKNPILAIFQNRVDHEVRADQNEKGTNSHQVVSLSLGDSSRKIKYLTIFLDKTFFILVNPGSDVEKYETPTDEDPPLSLIPRFDEEEEHHSTAQSKTSAKNRTAFYWIVLMLVMLFILFFTGSVFSCRAFNHSRDDSDFLYGYRGILHNVTGECISWEEYNETGSYWQFLISMGIAGVILLCIALGIWILEGTYGIGLAIETDNSTEAHSSPTTTSQRSCCVCLVIPAIFGIVLVVFGFLSFGTLMGSCSNLIRLDPGGLACGFSVWSSLGMFSSIAACFLGCSVCCGYHRSTR